MEDKLDNLNRRQDALLDQEARALGLMTEMAGLSEPDEQALDFRDPLFLQDDPANLDMPGDVPSPGPEGDLVFDWSNIPEDQQVDWGAILAADPGSALELTPTEKTRT